MPDLYITHALPNPAGKDRPGHGAPANSQLNGEWLQFHNSSGRQLDLIGLTLYHNTYNSRCQVTGQDAVTTFTGSLNPGTSIRVHTGSGQGHWEGDVFHFFLNRSNFIWNNDCGDAALLAVAAGRIDWAYYEPNPAEGQILRRVAGTNLLR